MMTTSTQRPESDATGGKTRNETTRKTFENQQNNTHNFPEKTKQI